MTRFDQIARHLQAAQQLARDETLHALKAPAQAILTLLHNRSEQLREDAELEAAIDRELLYQDDWSLL